jgi:chromosome segregation ATPase
MITLNQIYYGIVFIVVLTILGYIYSLKSDISDRDSTIATLQKDLLHEKTQNILHETAIDSQNKQIEDMRIDLVSSKAKLDEWKKLPPRVKYEVIYRDVVKENNLTGACDEVKTLINSTPNLNTL